MLTFSKISRRPRAFKRLTGVSLEDFEEIVEKVRPTWEEYERKRLSRPNRQRAIGGGGKYRLPTLHNKLIVIFLYYRTYVTMEFLGFLFDLDRSNICRLIQRLQAVLNKTAVLRGDRPKRDRSRKRKINNLKDFLKEYPEMEDLIIDVTEQQIERPKRQQKAYYSGKKKRHTLKTQIIVNEKGEIIDTTDSFPGRRHDKKIFDESKIKKSLPGKIHIMGDLGFQGIKDDFPNATIPHKKKRGGPELTKEQKRQNRGISRRRVLVDNVIGRLKIFKILSDRYRGNRNNHGDIFRIISHITNIKYGFAF